MKGFYQNYKVASSLVFSLFLSVFVMASPTTTVEVEGGTISTSDNTSFCYSDDIQDVVTFELSGGSGPHFLWLVTDESGNIISNESSNVIDFTNAGPGQCIVYSVSFKAFIFPPLRGMNVNSLVGWFALSNGITVNRSDCDGMMPPPPPPTCDADGGMLSGGPFTFCGLDGTPDMIGEDQIVLTGGSGQASAWVITDDMGNILGLPPTFAAVDFDPVFLGTCSVWYFAYNGPITGLAVGENVANITGCFDFSNPIEVDRIDCGNMPDMPDMPDMPACTADGGMLSGGPFTFCGLDGSPDMIGEDQIVLTGGSGQASAWVITDDMGNILGLPPTFTAVDFDPVFLGTCSVWYFAYNGPITGLAVGENVANITGCFDFSNPIEVNRIDCGGPAMPPPPPVCDADAGTLSGGPFAFCVLDGIADMIAPDQIVSSGGIGEMSTFVITDDLGNILALPSSFTLVNFDNVPPGLCLVWYLTHNGPIQGAEVGLNANDITGCFSLSNPIMVDRQDCTPAGNDNTAPDTIGDAIGDVCGVNSGTLQLCDGTGTNINICPSDGVDSSFEVCVDGNVGDSFFVLIDPERNLIAQQDSPIFDLEGFPAGLCIICHVSFEGELIGLVPGLPVDLVEGCIDFSNEISVSKFVDDPVFCFGLTGVQAEPELSFQTIGNPVEDVLRLQFDSDIQGPTRVVIYDIVGRTLFNDTVNIPEGNGQKTVDIDASEFDSGMHFVNVNNAGSSAVESFIKDDNK